MEVTALVLMYLLTILLPINGLLFLGMMNERKRNKKLVLALWKLKRRVRR